jgi:hypothetical protein
MTRLWKLLAILAVLLMPGEMAAASAAPQQQQSARSITQHCPDQSSPGTTKKDFADCTMACSAALPAGQLQAVQPWSYNVCETTTCSIVQQLNGLHPDTATPPPKHS